MVDVQLFDVAVGPQRIGAASCAVRAKTFRHYDPSQGGLLSPSLDDGLPEDYEARFTSETVEDLLDLSGIQAAYATADGASLYDPRMMRKLLFNSYLIGVSSSREMGWRCVTDVAFRFLSANAASDYRSIARFRRRRLKALDELFTQVLVLCATAGLVSLGRVALRVVPSCEPWQAGIRPSAMTS
jgi:transposase